MSNEINPYLSPVVPSGLPEGSYRPGRELASRLKRLLGAIIDFGFLALAVVVASQFAQFAERFDQGSVLSIKLDSLGPLFAIFAAVFIQGCLLFARSQSIGKLIVGTQVFGYSTGRRASFSQSFFVRFLLSGIFSVLSVLGAVYFVVDSLFIFGEERRCLHDLLADTMVVEISAGPGEVERDK